MLKNDIYFALVLTSVCTYLDMREYIFDHTEPQTMGDFNGVRERLRRLQSGKNIEDKTLLK